VAVASVLALSACATGGGVQQSQIKPVYRVDDGSQTYQGVFLEDAGKHYFQTGKYGLALQSFEAALQRNPRSVVALNGIGACYDKLQRYDVAMRYYYRALELNPASSKALNNVGYSFMLQGRNQEARSVLRLAANQHPDNSAIRANLLAVKGKIEGRRNLQVAARVLNGMAIEISNGNGRDGMARLLRDVFKTYGIGVSRVTNAENFAYERTAIYYAPGNLRAARDLSERLPVKAVFKEMQTVVRGIVLKVLLGRDFVSHEKALKQVREQHA
jgi:tetratricopeptide (TPR) repeat protein